ncbi:MAG: VOC family protein [bacterium]|nr:VOC family protein [bacterium]
MRPTLTHIALHVADLESCIEFYRSYCGMQIIHERSPEKSSADSPDAGKRIVWMAEAGRERELIFVLMPGGRPQTPAPRDYGHIGFALESRAAVDRIAERARREGRLSWEPVDEDYPVGYYCGVSDPNGTVIEFSYGQPLGPGAPTESAESPAPGEQARHDA